MPKNSSIEVEIAVFKEIPRFSQIGQKLDSALVKTDETISEGLAHRLHKHAETRLIDAGFKSLTINCEIEVYTLDAGECQSNRSYCVSFTNSEGGYVEVVGILTRKGWPTLDHGFTIGSKKAN